MLKRRLRIRTLLFGIARNMNELYDSADPEAVLSLLVHKVSLYSSYNNNLLKEKNSRI